MHSLVSLAIRFDDQIVNPDSSPFHDEVDEGDLVDVKLRFE